VKAAPPPTLSHSGTTPRGMQCAAIHAFRTPIVRHLRWAYEAVDRVQGQLRHGSTAKADAQLTVTQANTLQFRHADRICQRVSEAARSREIESTEVRIAGTLPKLRLRTSDVARIRNDLL